MPSSLQVFRRSLAVRSSRREVCVLKRGTGPATAGPLAAAGRSPCAGRSAPRPDAGRCRLLRGSVLACLLLSACGAAPDGDPAGRSSAASADAALAEALAAAATRSASALERLAAAEAAGLPSAAGEPEPVPAELLQRVDFSWTGPLDAAARALAALAGYELRVSGEAAGPVVVSLREEATPLISVLRSAGLQAGGRATLRVDPVRRLIEVIHGG